MGLTAAEKDRRLFDRIYNGTGIMLRSWDVRTLRRAELILRRESPYTHKAKLALRRAYSVCRAYGLHWYYDDTSSQCALYVAHERQGLNDTNYTVGVPISS